MGLAAIRGADSMPVAANFAWQAYRAGVGLLFSSATNRLYQRLQTAFRTENQAVHGPPSRKGARRTSLDTV